MQSLTRRTLVLGALVVAALGLTGCTSLGHEERAKPKIAKRITAVTEFGFDGDDNELSLAVQQYLEEKGMKLTLLSTPRVREWRGDKEYTYDEVQTRYVVGVRSIDLDTCIPEGSRQLSQFSIIVTDFKTRQKVLIMKGEFGCRNTLVKEFAKWFSGNIPAGSAKGSI